MKYCMLLLLLFLFIPVISVYGTHDEIYQPIIKDGFVFPLPSHPTTKTDYYWSVGTYTKEQYVIYKTYYKEDHQTYIEQQRLNRVPYSVQPWIYNIEHWMKTGQIPYDTHQYALDWLVNNGIAKQIEGLR